VQSRNNGPQVRNLIPREKYKVGSLLQSVLDLRLAHQSAMVGVEHHLQYHLRVIGRASFLGILGVDLAEIRHLHNLVDHACGMVWHGGTMGREITQIKSDDPSNPWPYLVECHSEQMPVPAALKISEKDLTIEAQPNHKRLAQAPATGQSWQREKTTSRNYARTSSRGILREKMSDEASSVFLDRIDFFKANPPGEDWDRVFERFSSRRPPLPTVELEPFFEDSFHVHESLGRELMGLQQFVL